MNTEQQYILTIAGHDPSGGAGLTSDIKTFEAHGLYGLSVCSAITVQNDVDFKNVSWVATDLIISQIETLFDRFQIDVVKIGIIENWNVLQLVVNKLVELNSEIKIVLDPIFKASAGFDFQSNSDLDVLANVLENITVITPNYDEIKSLFPDKSIDDTLEFISDKTNIYLKGGHRTDKKGWDELYHSKIVQCNIPPIAGKVSDKHGSGCVLSSSLAANLALGLSLEDASFKTKAYIETFLNSNESLLGTHKEVKNSKVIRS